MSVYEWIGTNHERREERLIENKRDAGDYSVEYTDLKARATNIMFLLAVTLAWAYLIVRRTANDTPR